MSGDAQDRAYSLEFRQEAVRLLRTSGRSVPQLARELGCSPQSLRNWARHLDFDEGKAEGLAPLAFDGVLFGSTLDPITPRATPARASAMTCE